MKSAEETNAVICISRVYIDITATCIVRESNPGIPESRIILRLMQSRDSDSQFCGFSGLLNLLIITLLYVIKSI
jgi:hypothetical protein